MSEERFLATRRLSSLVVLLSEMKLVERSI
jgi:hypothetical protein